MDKGGVLSSFSKFLSDSSMLRSSNYSTSLTNPGCVISFLLALDHLVAYRDFNHRFVLLSFSFSPFPFSPLCCAPESQVHVFAAAVCAS